MSHGTDLAAGGSDAGMTRGETPVEIVAHRGANREAPENTLPAFRRAIEMGVQGIEPDVQYTRDDVPVVHHDPAMAPRDVGGARPSISSLTLSELRGMSDVPTLDEVLDFVNGRCRLYIEIKASEAVAAVVERLAERRSWCAVHSFDHRAVAQAHTLDPRLSCGILLVSYLVDIAGAMRNAHAHDVWQNHGYVDRALVDAVHSAGGRVVAWTVNDVTRARELAEMGVDAICSDVPNELLIGVRRQEAGDR